jgi:hypothetical protein
LFRKVGLDLPWLNTQRELATVALGQGSGQGQTEAGSRTIVAAGATFTALENELSFLA